MSYVSQWLQALIVLLIFAAVVEMLVPRGSTRRYVRIALGLLILLALLHPIVELLGLEPDWEGALPSELVPAFQATDGRAQGEDAVVRLRAGPRLESVRAVLAQRLTAAVQAEVMQLEGVAALEVIVRWREPSGADEAGFAGLTVLIDRAAPGGAPHGPGGGNGGAVRVEPVPDVAVGAGQGPPAGHGPGTTDGERAPPAAEDPAAVALAADVAWRLERRLGLLPTEVEILVRSERWGPDQGPQEGGLE